MFHCLLPVRDEADIIDQCLRHLLTWADAIYIFDTGSVDNTWEIVQDFAAKDQRVILLGKDPVYFNDVFVRGWMFHQARKNMRNGDWFLRCDADEFHHIPPPEFVRTRLRSHETMVWHQYYDFRLTESETQAWEAGKETLADRQRPIEERRRWFTPSLYSEPRLCRYRETMQWPTTHSFPVNSGFVAQERLPIRHYPHRDPVQLERRCRLRAVMMADEENRYNWTRPELHHWAEAEWRKFITPDHLSGLQYWQSGTKLPEFQFTNHLANVQKRMIQRLVHSFCLPLLDHLRAQWPDDAYPQKISVEIQADLESKFKVSAIEER
jgi:glycosyltransferase involved in cell wall biosynthesis